MAKTPTLLRGSFIFVISNIIKLIHAFHSFSSTALGYPDHAQSKESVSRGQRPRFLSGVLQTPNHGIALKGYNMIWTFLSYDVFIGTLKKPRQQWKQESGEIK